MSVFGLPIATFIMLVATAVAGSLGAIHYVIVHKLVGKPFPNQEVEE